MNNTRASNIDQDNGNLLFHVMFTKRDKTAHWVTRVQSVRVFYSLFIVWHPSYSRMLSPSQY